MGWYGNDDLWGSTQSQSPFLYYLNFVLLVSCLVILACAVFFVIRECCQDNQMDEERETIVIRHPTAQVPSYTESHLERDQSYNHRIVHEYNQQSLVPASDGSQVAPHHYYAYDPKRLETYYMYPTPCSRVEMPSTSSTTSDTTRLVQHNYGDLPPQRDDRPPPYAPTH